MSCDTCPIEWVPKPFTGRGTDAAYDEETP